MLSHTNPVLNAWTAFLRLPDADRHAFLLHAGAYLTAAAPLDPARRGGSTLVLPEPVEHPACSVLGKRDGLSARESLEQETPTRNGPDPIGSLVPLIGGPDLDLAPRSAFREAAFIRAWRPGSVLSVYTATCPGLTKLSRDLQLRAKTGDFDKLRHARLNDTEVSVQKIGISVDVGSRMGRLGRQQHGSLCKADPALRQPGFDRWTAQPLPNDALDPSPGSPVRVHGNRLELTLPQGTTSVGFDQALARALASATLANWAMSGAGKARCATRDIDPLTLVRGTPDKGRIAWVQEIVLIRPRTDAIRLLRLIEDLIIAIVCKTR